ncbi:hypothetical protein HYQ46_009409 [Verticillium longisporum]|nr:hypothetical protein HYQ46_009409 [Verticillium longisporum]
MSDNASDRTSDDGWDNTLSSIASSRTTADLVSEGTPPVNQSLDIDLLLIVFTRHRYRVQLFHNLQEPQRPGAVLLKYRDHSSHTWTVNRWLISPFDFCRAW